MDIKYKLDISKAIDMQWGEALKLMKVGKFDDFRPLIKPYLIYGPLYKKSKEDVIREWKGLLCGKTGKEGLSCCTSCMPKPLTYQKKKPSGGSTKDSPDAENRWSMCGDC